MDKIGLHSQDTSELFFDNVKVPKDQLLGQPGQGFVYLMQELPRERTAIAATALGAIRGSIDVTTQYVKERQAFGQAIGQFRIPVLYWHKPRLTSWQQQLSITRMLSCICKASWMLKLQQR